MPGVRELSTGPTEDGAGRVIAAAALPRQRKSVWKGFNFLDSLRNGTLKSQRLP